MQRSLAAIVRQCTVRRPSVVGTLSLPRSSHVFSFSFRSRYSRSLSTSSDAVDSAVAAASLESALSSAHSLLRDRVRILAITGAGISTESGIPDYRSPGRPPHRPTSHQQFMSSHATRQRYWARSMTGFETLSFSRPNEGHFALAAAERSGRLSGVITQNVDLLHEASGSREVLHLHGTVEQVRCMSCEALADRATFQRKLRAMNPDFSGNSTKRIPKDPFTEAQDHLISAAHATSRSVISIPSTQRPDGDSDMAHVTDYTHFRIPSCEVCTDGHGNALEHIPIAHAQNQPAGILKPDLVFFGANVPRGVHEQADDMLSNADALLIAGTSLTVWSAFRLVRAALAKAKYPQAQSVVEVAEQMAKLRQAVANTTTAGSSGSNGSNTISDGSALLAPVTPFSLTTDPSHPSRVPASIPVVILNSGPTRADPFVAAASWGVHKLEARTGEALRRILDVTEQQTRLLQEEATRKRADKQAATLSPQALQANMQRHENIE